MNLGKSFLYSEDSLKFPSFPITQPKYLSEATITSPLRNAYVAVGTAGIAAAIVGSLILLTPRLATASWPFANAAQGGSDALVHDPGLNLLEAAINPDPNPLKDDQTLVISEDSALLAEGGIDSADVGSLSQPEDAPQEVAKADKPAETVKKVETKTPAKPAAKPAAKPTPKPVAKTKPSTAKAATIVKTASAGYFSNPCPACHLSQGIHGHNGVDLAGPLGTPIYAAASGTVTLIKGGDAWNGGYGNYVVVTHPNGTSTLYAHMSRIAASSGASVAKGQILGYVGSTGESTGNHLHFEVHGAVNPFGH